MNFSDNYENDSYHENSYDSKYKENIIILKRVKSIRQLKNSEKEWIRLCYKEAILKGGTYMKDIQYYIASKTKIWIERTGIEFLKKSEEEDDKRWFKQLASDHFAYVGVHRRIIDELEQYKKELWSLMKDPETTIMEKIHVTRELHNLTKTHGLILRDLPFVTNLSKYYNLDLINENSHQQVGFQKTMADKKSEEEIIEQKVSERMKKMFDESGFGMLLNKKINISTELHNDTKKSPDNVMENLRSQLKADRNTFDKMFESKDYKESVKKIKDLSDH